MIQKATTLYLIGTNSDHHSMGSGTNNANDVLRPQPPLLLLQPSVIQDVAFFSSRNSRVGNFLKKQINQSNEIKMYLDGP